MGHSTPDAWSAPVRDRWMGVGRSANTDADAAADEALDGALARRGDARLLVAFAADGYDYPRLVRRLNDGASGAELIGCSTAGEIASSGPGDDGLVVVAFGGGGFTASSSASPDAGRDMRSAGSHAAAAALAGLEPRTHTVMLTLTDAFAGDQQDALRGMYHELGAAIPFVGGCAGDGLKMHGTHQFHGDRVLTDAIVVAAIGSDAPFGVGVRHGWEPFGPPMLVTRSDGTCILELDGQPALDTYLSRLFAPKEAGTSSEAFMHFSLEHPIGLPRREGEPGVRFIGEVDFERRGLVTLVAIPEGAHVRLMRGTAASVMAATDAACTDALAVLDGAPLGMLVFDCIARREVLGAAGTQDEVARIVRHADGAPVAGFYTYGEIARPHGVSGFHNETLVVLAVG